MKAPPTAHRQHATSQTVTDASKSTHCTRYTFPPPSLWPPHGRARRAARGCFTPKRENNKTLRAGRHRAPAGDKQRALPAPHRVYADWQTATDAAKSTLSASRSSPNHAPHPLLGPFAPPPSAIIFAGHDRGTRHTNAKQGRRQKAQPAQAPRRPRARNGRVMHTPAIAGGDGGFIAVPSAASTAAATDPAADPPPPAPLPPPPPVGASTPITVAIRRSVARTAAADARCGSSRPFPSAAAARAASPSSAAHGPAHGASASGPADLAVDSAAAPPAAAAAAASAARAARSAASASPAAAIGAAAAARTKRARLACASGKAPTSRRCGRSPADTRATPRAAAGNLASGAGKTEGTVPADPNERRGARAEG